jgi:hypothetical protein
MTTQHSQPLDHMSPDGVLYHAQEALADCVRRLNKVQAKAERHAAKDAKRIRKAEAAVSRARHYVQGWRVVISAEGHRNG